VQYNAQGATAEEMNFFGFFLFLADFHNCLPRFCTSRARPAAVRPHTRLPYAKAADAKAAMHELQ